MLDESVSRALAMRVAGGRYEVIVVDNGSSDATAAILDDLRARHAEQLVTVSEPTPGISRARNAGIEVARGNWLLFLDDDAWVPDDLLCTYRRWLKSFPDSWAWGGGATLRYPEKLPLCWGPAFDGMLSALDMGDEPRVLSFPQTPYGLNMLIHREVFRRHGGFREEITFGGDETDLFLRMAQAGQQVRYAPGCMVVHAVDTGRFSIRWLLAASFRSGGYHAKLDHLNGGLRIGWQMISSGWLKILLGRRGCVPIALGMHLLRIAGYLSAGRKGRGVDA